MLPGVPKGFFAAALLSLTLSASMALAQQPAARTARAPRSVTATHFARQLRRSPKKTSRELPSAPSIAVRRRTVHAARKRLRGPASTWPVVDSAGRSVQTLDKDAFRVFEDDVPQTIASFRHEDLPVSLGILIDSSGSMYDKRPAVDAASLDLVKLSNPEDEAFLVDFSWEAFIDQDFTNDIDKLQQGLSYIKSSGGTAIYDALVASADYLAKNAKHPKQVLLVITDGEDNASSATLELAIRRIQDFDGPVVYCIGLLFGDDTSKCESRHARRVLETLSEQTGGSCLLSQVGERCGCHRQRGGQRHPHPVHHRLPLHQAPRTGRLPRGPRRGQGQELRQALRAHTQRLLPARHPHRRHHLCFTHPARSMSLSSAAA